uniref:Uncharacterized protein n=1 Tax=uncultured haloarchaeon TaxID=160804 RepID=A0A0K1YBM4_9EURY|nr:hypothetical protein [uncultured haloarchaeon]
MIWRDSSNQYPLGSESSPVMGPTGTMWLCAESTEANSS